MCTLSTVTCQWLHVTLPRTPTFLFPTVCLACGPGLRPARNGNAERNAPVLHDTATGCSALRTGLSAQLREPQDTGSQVHPAFPPWEAGCSHCMARRAQHTRYAPGAQVAAPPVALDQSPRQPPSRNDTRASLGAVPLVHVLLSAPMLLGLPPLGAALDRERSGFSPP